MKLTGGFKEFYERHKNKFPYNDVKVTRNRYHAKWLLVSCKTDPSILFFHCKCFPLLCSTVNPEIVQHMILSKEGIPLPDDFSHLLDCMYYWGRGISAPWYKKTLELINFYLNNSGLNRSNFTATHLYFDVIEMRVLQLINSHFTHGHSAIHDQWRLRYTELVNSGNTDFFSLTVRSFRYVDAIIDSVISASDFTEENVDANVPAIVGSSP